MNPFNKLKVQRDEDEKESSNVNKEEKAKALFDANKEAAKKKKKVRPTDDKKDDKAEEENDDGFEVVGGNNKKQKYVKNDYDESENYQKEQVHSKKNDYGHKHEGKVRINSNQRAFDRQSGTGYGTEVKKEGAGGKGTWGNQEKYAKREVVEYYDDTDYYFNQALNPKVRKEKVDVVVDEKVVEEKKPVEKTEVVAEEVEKKEEGEYKDKKDRKKKGVVDPEEDEKNKLIIPENAKTLKEYKEQNKKTETTTKPKVEVKVDLEQTEKPKDYTLSIAGKTQNDKKKKVKEVNAKEQELNKLVSSGLKIDNSFKSSDNKNYQKKTNNNNNFKFKAEEFPELK